MRKLSILIFAATLVLAVTASTEVSAEKGWFTGFSAGQASWGSYTDEMEGYDIESLDDSDLGYLVFGGYQITSRFGVVGGYADLGELTASGTYDFSSDGFTDVLDVSGPFAAGQVYFPVSDRFVTFITAGVFFWDIGYAWTEGEMTYTGSENGTGLMYGVGCNFWLNSTQNSGIHIEWDQFSAIGDTAEESIGHEVDIDLFSVGWVYRFGK